MREAARWLEARGDKLWDANELRDEDIALRARRGELVIGSDDEVAVACFYLQNEDRVFWPLDDPGEALYVHRLAVRRGHAGRGWCGRLLDWAAGEARDRGCAWLRLDTELRPRLISLYELSGFARVDVVPIVLGGHRVIRFERRV